MSEADEWVDKYTLSFKWVGDVKVTILHNHPDCDPYCAFEFEWGSDLSEARLHVEVDCYVNKTLEDAKKRAETIARKIGKSRHIFSCESNDSELRAIYEMSGKVPAIRKHREDTGDSLKDAVEHINELSREWGWVLPEKQGR